MSTKNWMSWILVAAMTTGGAGLALGGALGARASSREPVARTEPTARVESAPIARTIAAPSAPAHEAPVVAREAPAPRPSTGTFSIRRVQVTSGIDHREPIDHTTSFGDESERVYAFVDVANPTDEARHLEVSFTNGQRTTGLVTLEIPAHNARFRTWAYRMR